jgi:hypothetical protein
MQPFFFERELATDLQELLARQPWQVSNVWRVGDGVCHMVGSVTCPDLRRLQYFCFAKPVLLC